MTEGEYFREQLITFIENHKEDFISDYENILYKLCFRKKISATFLNFIGIEKQYISLN